MALLGSSVDPRLFMQDFSGFTRAADIQAQGMANLGGQIGSGIQKYGEAKAERKKLDAGIKATVTGIESAIKMGKSLGIDVESSLSPFLEKINDPNVSPTEAAAYAQQASSSISNVLNFGIKAQDQASEANKLKLDAAYKNEQLKIAQQNANSRAQTALASGNAPPSTLDVSIEGGTQKMQWAAEKGSYVPINVSGLGEESTSSLNNLPAALKPFAKDFEIAGAKYGVPANILAAISMHETGNGTSSAFLNKNNAMGISDASGPVKVESVAESIDKMARLLGKGINEGTGPYANAKSIADIANIYAPPGAGNDPGNLNQFWTQGVTSNIQKLSENQAEQVGPTAPQPRSRPGFAPTKEGKGEVVTAEEAQKRVESGLSVTSTPIGGGMVRITSQTGSPKPSPVIESPQSKLQTQRLLELDKSLGSLREAGTTASLDVEPLKEITNLLNTNVKTGFGRETLMQAKKIFGQDVSSEEDFQARVGAEAMKNIALTKGAISDREMDYFKTVLSPNMGKTTEGNKKIIDFRIKYANRANKIAKTISSLQKEQKDPYEIQEAVDQIISSESLLTEEKTPERSLSANERLRLKIKPQGNR